MVNSVLDFALCAKMKRSKLLQQIEVNSFYLQFYSSTLGCLIILDLCLRSKASFILKLQTSITCLPILRKLSPWNIQTNDAVSSNLNRLSP